MLAIITSRAVTLRPEKVSPAADFFSSVSRLAVVFFLLAMLLPLARAEEQPASPQITGAATAQPSQTQEPRLGGEIGSLRAGFLDPPGSARPAAYWCWLNGYVDEPQALWELNEFREKGLSGLYVFDIVAQAPEGMVPAGPAFMSRDWVRVFGNVVREAKKLGLEIGLITSSSWNAGGPWVTPEYAAMGLFTTQATCEGPAEFDEELPRPKLPEAAHQHPGQLPPIYRDVAILAIPAEKTLETPFFVFRLAPPGRHIVDHVILCNTASEDADKTGPLNRFVKEFAVWISDSDDAPESFHRVLKAELQPTTEPQRFDFPATPARYIKLELLSRYNPAQQAWELGEFEVYSVTGKNVASRLSEGGSRTGAALVRFLSQRRASGPWSADCIHDGVRGGPKGSWASADDPSLLIEDPAKVVDLTSLMDSAGRLRWQVPPGRWRIVRFGYGNTGQRLVLPSPNSAGWAIDHFNPQATDWHFKHILESLVAELGPLDQTALKQLYVCSYELRGASWTPRLPEEFRRRRGYELRPFLPVLVGCVVKNEATTRRFIRDYETTLSDLIIDGFYGRTAEICHQHGLKLCAEAGGPGLPLHPVPVDAIKAQGAVDIPRGEFWVDEDIWVVKETACAAQIYGQPMVDMEAFTSWRHWQDGPAELKPVADRALCEGANHFTFHTAAHRPKEAGLPGWVYTAGTHFSPSIVWWHLAKPFVNYLARCSFLLQQGEPVTDVCYYYGDRGFNFVLPKAIDPELGFGYDYTVTDTRALLENATVRHGRICFGPEQEGVALLVLPPGSEVTPEVMARLDALIHSGATVVGQKPSRSPSLTGYPDCDEQVKRSADQIWGENPPPQGERAWGDGRVVWGRPLKEVLARMGVPPDVVLRSTADASLDYVHRRTPRAHIYFFRNRLPRWEHFVVRLRAFGHFPQQVPQVWNPVTGKVASSVAYRVVEDGLEVPLDLPPHGSIFVVVTKHDELTIKHDEASTKHLDVTAKHDEVVPAHNGVAKAHNEVVIGQRAGAHSEANPVPLTSLTRDGQEILFAPFCGGSPAEIGVAVKAGVGVEIGVGDGRPNQLELHARQAGEYTATFQSGKKQTVTVEAPATQKITGPWQVAFPPGWGAPTQVVFSELISWTEHPKPGIKYFSGIATYRTTFPIQPGTGQRRICLNLGEVRFVAEVIVNGKNLGVLWTPPYELDISDAVHDGENELVVRVANVWSNRLTGDARQPQFGTFTQTNIKYAVAWKVAWKDAPLHRSGLLGPVQIIALPRTRLEP